MWSDVSLRARPPVESSRANPLSHAFTHRRWAARARARQVRDDVRRNAHVTPAAYEPRDGYPRTADNARGESHLERADTRKSRPRRSWLAVQSRRLHGGKPRTSHCPERRLTSDQSPVSSSSRFVSRIQIPRRIGAVTDRSLAPVNPRVHHVGGRRSLVAGNIRRHGAGLFARRVGLR